MNTFPPSNEADAGEQLAPGMTNGSNPENKPIEINASVEYWETIGVVVRAMSGARAASTAA